MNRSKPEMTESAVTTNAPQGRSPELESVRGLAALLVFFFHLSKTLAIDPAMKWTDPLNFRFVHNGEIMVELFFVLSGFVISASYLDKIKSLKDLLRFQFLRVCRLYPVHLLFLLVAIAYSWLKLVAPDMPGTQFTQEEGLDWSSFVHHIFLTQSLWPEPAASRFNLPSWSISTEFYTYLLFGLLVLVSNRHRRLAILGAAIVSNFLLIRNSAPQLHLALRCTSGFLIGCLTEFLVRTQRRRVPPFTTDLVLVVLLAFVAVKNSKVYDPFMYLLGSLLILSIILNGKSITSSILRARPLVWLGGISYSLYMSHYLIIKFAVAACHSVSGVWSGAGIPQVSLMNTVIFEVLALAATLYLSHLTFHLLETPTRESSRRFAQNRLK